MASQGADPTVVWNALSAASLFALGAEGLDDYHFPIEWLEKRLSARPAPIPVYRRLFSNALGGLLLRAGRVDEAIARVNEGIAAAPEAEMPTDWAYVALAQRERETLPRLSGGSIASASVRPDSSASFWDLQEIALLRSEAESVLFDAEFPRDPFQGREAEMNNLFAWPPAPSRRATLPPGTQDASGGLNDVEP